MPWRIKCFLYFNRRTSSMSSPEVLQVTQHLCAGQCSSKKKNCTRFVSTLTTNCISMERLWTVNLKKKHPLYSQSLHKEVQSHEAENDQASFKSTTQYHQYHSINQQATASKPVSDFSCFLIGYLFIDTESLSSEEFADPVVFVPIKWDLSKINLIPDKLLFLNG